MKRFVLTVLFLLLANLALAAADGMVHVRSAYDVAETGDRLEAVLQEKGMTIFNRIKHSEAANAVGVPLRDTELIIFGNPKVGSPLMQCRQSVAIDLPQKALIWKDAEGTVRITYNDPAYLKKRHAIRGCDAVLEKVTKALSGITRAAAGKN